MTGKPPMSKVQIGDYVRSYDFPYRFASSDDCYLEGVVIEVVNEIVTIVVITRVWDGEVEDDFEKSPIAKTWTHDALFDRLENGSFQILISADSINPTIK